MSEYKKKYISIGSDFKYFLVIISEKNGNAEATKK